MSPEIMAGPLLAPLNVTGESFPISHVKLVSVEPSGCTCEPKCRACQNANSVARGRITKSAYMDGLIPTGHHKHDPKCPAPDGPGQGFNHG